MCDRVLQGEAKEAILGDEYLLRFMGQVCVNYIDNLIQSILSQAYSLRYSIHLNKIEMYNNLRLHYWLYRIKQDKDNFVSKCQNC